MAHGALGLWLQIENVLLQKSKGKKERKEGIRHGYLLISGIHDIFLH